MTDSGKHIQDLRDRIKAGEAHLVDELIALIASSPVADTATTPTEIEPIREGSPIKVKRSYTMSEAALAARRANAQLSTGPRTPEGKANIITRNGWKHGRYAKSRILGIGKPCRTTCPDYPCGIVEEGRTRAGGDCLDKEYLLEACQAIEKALIAKDYGDFNSLMVMELGETLSVVRELRASILEHGVVVERALTDKDGNVIGHDLKPHPSLLALPNLMKNLGISFNDFLATPAALARTQNEKETAETLADIFKSASDALKKAKAGTIDRGPGTGE